MTIPLLASPTARCSNTSKLVLIRYKQNGLLLMDSVLEGTECALLFLLFLPSAGCREGMMAGAKAAISDCEVNMRIDALHSKETR